MGTINASLGLFKMCRLPHGLENSSSILQTCIESTLKGIKGVVIFHDDVFDVWKYQEPVRQENDCSQESTTREKLLLIRKNQT